MIDAHLHLFDLDPVTLGNIQQQLAHPLTHYTTQNLLAIFGRPHQMILSVIHAVRATTKSHTSILCPTPCSAATLLRSFLPAASSGASRAGLREGEVATEAPVLGREVANRLVIGLIDDDGVGVELGENMATRARPTRGLFEIGLKDHRDFVETEIEKLSDSYASD